MATQSEFEKAVQTKLNEQDWGLTIAHIREFLDAVAEAAGDFVENGESVKVRGLVGITISYSPKKPKRTVEMFGETKEVGPSPAKVAIRTTIKPAIKAKLPTVQKMSRIAAKKAA